ncbi:hypothetical protein C8Q73DRAFT_832215 [Cubamyces lactineus]|nr:hypothetical protein C8Q73DRAFT_832215 [Cubamyces lactineus]
MIKVTNVSEDITTREMFGVITSSPTSPARPPSFSELMCTLSPALMQEAGTDTDGTSQNAQSSEAEVARQEIVFKDGSLHRNSKQTRILPANVAFDLFHTKSVNDILMAVYDALELHRMLAGKRRVVHRDMCIFNILMYPTFQHGADQQKSLQDCPRPIDEVLLGNARAPEKQRARCLLIDYDDSAKLTTGNASAITQKTLRCRTGTPSYTARAVCAGAVHSERSSLFWDEQMPLLEGNARDLYIKVYGEERYNKYNDLSPDTIHGGIPPSRTKYRQLQAKAAAMPFYHRWEYDAESLFWTMYSALLRVTPVGFTEKPKDGSAASLTYAWEIFRKHAIPKEPKDADTRTTLLSDGRGLMAALPPCMAPVGELLLRIIYHILPSYPLMDVLPPHDDHLHEAIERLILQYLVDNRDTPIPLIPHQLRPVYCSEPDVRAARRTI